MWNNLRRHPLPWAMLGGLLTAAAVLIVLAPPEQTLGNGVKVVFIHASLMQTGAIGLIAAGLVGLVVAALGRAELAGWMRAIGGVALAFYAAGLGMSMVAAQINWGGVYLQEPRMAAGLNTLALALIVMIADEFLMPSRTGQRIAGLLSAGLAVFMVWAIAVSPLVLHPRNPIGTSPSFAIQASFYGLLGVTILAAIWTIWQVRKHGAQDETSVAE